MKIFRYNSDITHRIDLVRKKRLCNAREETVTAVVDVEDIIIEISLN